MASAFLLNYKNNCPNCLSFRFFFVTLHQVSANRHNMTLTKVRCEPQWRCQYDLCGIIIALVLYSVMSLNLGNSIDINTA